MKNKFIKLFALMIFSGCALIGCNNNNTDNIKITFDANEGIISENATSKSITVKSGTIWQDITNKPTAKWKDDSKDFVYWTLDDKKTKIEDSYKFDNDITLYAFYDDKSIEVSWFPNGGRIEDIKVPDATLPSKVGSKFSELNLPYDGKTLDGPTDDQVFIGWSLNKDKYEEVPSTWNLPASGANFYAHYNYKNVEVVWEPNGGKIDGKVMSEAIVQSKINTKFNDLNFPYDGKKLEPPTDDQFFIGWSLNKDKYEEVPTDWELPNTGAKFYAYFEYKGIEVTWEPNGGKIKGHSIGEATVPSKKFSKFNELNLPYGGETLEGPTDDEEFLGWSLNQDNYEEVPADWTLTNVGVKFYAYYKQRAVTTIELNEYDQQNEIYCDTTLNKDKLYNFMCDFSNVPGETKEFNNCTFVIQSSDDFPDIELESSYFITNGLSVKKNGVEIEYGYYERPNYNYEYESGTYCITIKLFNFTRDDAIDAMFVSKTANSSVHAFITYY